MFDMFSVADMSRTQFGLTATYHFLFVPLTIGLIFIIAVMETIYVKTGDVMWKKMVQYWGVLFGINFAMGVATGITMEFQFGTNWAYYSHYVGDIFGAPLAIEGMMAFFLEATFVGLFFFGWERLSAKKHLMVTWLVFFGTNMSALWILVANGWMQYPVGAEFNMDTMRMELTSFKDVFFNPLAQLRYAHTLFASYVMAAVFVVAISSYYLLKNRNIEFAKRSIFLSSIIGLISIVLVVYFGDEQGYQVNEHQKSKMAATEAQWETQEAPADLVLFAIPDAKTQTNKFEITFPKALGYIATRGSTEQITGIKDLLVENRVRVTNGISVYRDFLAIKGGNADQVTKDRFESNMDDLGYGLLLAKYTDKIVDATPEQIEMAAQDTIPSVITAFFAFRIMVGAGLAMMLFFAIALFYSYRNNYQHAKWLQRIALLMLPLPWLATTSGWILAEVGRQPWVVFGVLPTAMGVSSVSQGSLIGSISGFAILYTGLLIVDVYLLLKYTKIGPEGKKH